MITMKQKLILRGGVLTILIFLIYGCATDNHKYQAYQDMKELVLNKDAPRLGYILFFETDSKNKIAYREAYYLQSELNYSSKFKEIDIESFFKDIMLGKTILVCGDLVECFTLSPVIMNEYKKKGLEKFIKKYATYDEKDKDYTINPVLSYDEKLSIAYCFYLNNIYTVENNDSGYFISQRVPLYTPVIMSDDLLEEINE